MNEATFQFVLLLFQAALWSGFLVLAQSASRVVGLALVYLFVGAVQMPQTLLAAGVFIQFSPTMQISPGSAVLFSGSLFAVLLVHRVHGPVEARRLIYGVFTLNIFLSMLMASFALQLDSAMTVNALGISAAALMNSAEIILIGSLVLLLDVIAIVAVYEWLGRFGLWSGIRVYLTLAGVLALDATLFVVLSFGGADSMWAILQSALLSKSAVAAVYTAALVFAIRRFPSERPRFGFRKALAFLTFRTDVKRLIREVNTDALTGAYSRRYLDSILESEVRTSARSDLPFSVLMVDADHFKSVNDTYGHAAGDQVLVTMVAAMRRAVRDRDSICRFGGEEFTVVMPGAALDAAAVVAERIRSEIEAEPMEVLGDRNLTVSVGVACCPDDATSVEDLLAIADKRLYSAKALGRNRVIAEDQGGKTGSPAGAVGPARESFP